MPSRTLLASLVLAVSLSPRAGAQEPSAPSSSPTFLEYQGTPNKPGSGHFVALLAGDEEYRSEEALPMLARILSTHHGFKTRVLFSQNPDTGEIDPEEQTYVPGLEVLNEADAVVLFWRFRELPDASMAHFVRYLESGKPLLAIRTSTHAFFYTRNKESRYARYSWENKDWPGGFGQQILGDTWIAHHGDHGKESTRGVLEPENFQHPVLRGVLDVWGPTDVYAIKNLPPQARVLLRGQILQGMTKDAAPVQDERNQPMMPITWYQEQDNEGNARRTVTSTIGAATDLESEDLRRLFVNAIYWGLGLEAQIPPGGSKSTLVGPYDPSDFGFKTHRKGLRPIDLR